MSRAKHIRMATGRVTRKHFLPFSLHRRMAKSQRDCASLSLSGLINSSPSNEQSSKLPVSRDWSSQQQRSRRPPSLHQLTLKITVQAWLGVSNSYDQPVSLSGRMEQSAPASDFSTPYMNTSGKNESRSGRWQEWHFRIGESKERSYGPQALTIAAELANHFEQGQVYDKAVHYHEWAGRTALQRYAYPDAEQHFTHGLQLLSKTAHSSERLQRELSLQASRVIPLSVRKGWTHPEVAQVCARAHALCRQVGDVPELFPVLRSLALFHLVRSELRTARQLEEQLVSLAQRNADPLQLLDAHVLLGGTLVFLGEFSLAVEHFEVEPFLTILSSDVYTPSSLAKTPSLISWSRADTCYGVWAIPTGR